MVLDAKKHRKSRVSELIRLINYSYAKSYVDGQQLIC